MTPPVVVLLTDYGRVDEFVGVCHGVIVQDCPAARIIDLSHDVPRHDVRAGALMLARALPYLPDGVLLAVVDPGVGGPRRAVAARAHDGRMLVGPDNGLLWPAAQACGGVAAAVDIGETPVARVPISATFHGRDLFAPVAAALAAGVPLAELGSSVAPVSLVSLPLPQPRRDGDGVRVHVLAVDSFGNLGLDAAAGALAVAPGDSVEVTVAAGERPRRVRRGRTFGDVAPGELVLYADPSGRLSLAVNRGSAAEALGLGADAQLRLAAWP